MYCKIFVVAGTLAVAACGQNDGGANAEPASGNSSAAAGPQAVQAAGYEGRGTVTAVDAEGITISHEPIEKLGWPSMTMKFPVPENLEIGNLALGSDVRFTFTDANGGSYPLTSIEAR